LTGIDFCYPEEGHPPKDKAAFFSAVRQFNAEHPTRALAILYHVGESFGDKSLESAIRWGTGSRRAGRPSLGHAIALGVDPDVFGVHSRVESAAERRDQLVYDLDHLAGLRDAGVNVDPASIQDKLSQLAGLAGDAPITISYDQVRLDDLRRLQDYAMGRVRATGAVIVVCPTSNRRTGGIQVPDPPPRSIGSSLLACLSWFHRTIPASLVRRWRPSSTGCASTPAAVPTSARHCLRPHGAAGPRRSPDTRSRERQAPK
jgi:hypothetical protein